MKSYYEYKTTTIPKLEIKKTGFGMVVCLS